MVRSLIAGSTASFLISFAALVVTARLFPLDFISDVKAVTVYGGWFSVVCTFQVHSAFLFFYREHTAGGEKLRAFTIRFLLAAGVVSGAVFYAALPLLYDAVHLNRAGRIAFSGVVGMNLIFNVSPAMYTAQLLGRRLARLMLLYPSAALLSLLVARSMSLDVNGYASVLFILCLAALAATEWRGYVAVAIRPLTRAPMGDARAFRLYSARIFSSNVLEAIGDRIDKVFASLLLAPPLFARYSVVCFENPVVGILLNSYGLALVKQFQGGVGGRELEFVRAWERMIRIVSFVTFPISLFLVWHSDWFISLTFGERFIEAEAVLRLYLLVSLLRYAPFQALLRMQGLVHYNAVMAAGFVAAAVAVGGAVAFLGADWRLLAFAYLAGWLVFNSLAVTFFSRRAGVRWMDVLNLKVWAARVAQCAVAGAAGAAVAGGQPAVSLILSSVSYLVLVAAFDPVMRDAGRTYVYAAIARVRAASRVA